MTNLNMKTKKDLERIAMKASYALEQRGGIDGRGGDSVDFLEVSVYSIQTMLEEAYRLGRKDAQKNS